MKTTLDIPSALLSEAMRLAGAKTKRAAVLAALDDFSKRGRMREMAMRLGNSETFMTAVELETLPPWWKMAMDLIRICRWRGA
jgi:Arc/MetJ family transcription regulator